MHNRIHNIYNKHQTTVAKVLCVCSAGLLRSPTTANVLHQQYGFNTRAAGAVLDFALIPIDKVLLEWADEIVCVEPKVRDNVELFINREVLEGRMDMSEAVEWKEKITTLNVPDMYQWNDPDLRKIIQAQYEEVGKGKVKL